MRMSDWISDVCSSDLFGLNRGCETSVVGAQFELEGALLDCELPLQLFDLGELLFVEAQFLMQGLVEGTGFLGGMIRNAASYENAGERRQKGDDGDEQRSAGTDAHHPPVSRVEGASSAAAPMRGRDCSALADSLGTRPPAIPIASAAVTAANRKGRGKSCAPKLGLEIFSSIDEIGRANV